MWWKSRWMLFGAANVLLALAVPVAVWASTRDGTALTAGCLNCHGFWNCLKCVVCEAVVGVPC